MWARHPLISSLLIIVLGGFELHSAMRYAAVAPTEKTTDAYLTYDRGTSRKSYSIPDFSREYHCIYNFTVDGESYSSSAEVSELSVDDSIKKELRDSQDSTGAPVRFNATVYYDPSNPSMNSLTEFGAKSKGCYQGAALFISIGGIVIIGFVVFRAASTKNS
jgi:hypothetical protein